MLKLSKLRGLRGRIVRSLTGLELEEIDALLPAFRQALGKRQRSWTQVTKAARQRRKGAGKTAMLEAEDLLLLILVYFRVYPTQDLLAFLFGGGQSWACKWVHRLTPVLEASLGRKQALPLRTQKRVSTVEELLEQCPELSFIIDGTERPIRRPKNKDKQKSRYSGKKKRHTIKNTLVSTQGSKRVAFVSATFDGSVHDKKMVDLEPIEFPQGSALYQDTGYQGYCAPGVATTLQPRKKHRGKARTEEDKIFNREVSRIRVRVEHTIGGVKRSRIVSDIFRNIKPDFEDHAMFVACGLHNFRCDARAQQPLVC